MLACCVASLLIAAATPTPTRPAATRTPTPRATTAPTPAPTATPTLAPTVTPQPTPSPAGGLLPTPPAASVVPTATVQTAPVEQVRVGSSAQGRPIDAYIVGDASRQVLVVGDIHGWPEANTGDLVWALLSTFVGNPALMPSSLGLIFIPEANPDGLANGTRELADGVDPNRNWPTADWSPDTFGPDGYLPAGGGPTPLSEPETQALATFVVQRHPVAVISYHSAAALVTGGPGARSSGLFDAYVEASGYLGDIWTAYPVSGDFAQWCDIDLHIPTVEIELSDHVNPEIDRNLAAVLSVMRLIALNPSY